MIRLATTRSFEVTANNLKICLTLYMHISNDSFLFRCDLKAVAKESIRVRSFGS